MIQKDTEKDKEREREKEKYFASRILDVNNLIMKILMTSVRCTQSVSRNGRPIRVAQMPHWHWTPMTTVSEYEWAKYNDTEKWFLLRHDPNCARYQLNRKLGIPFDTLTWKKKRRRNIIYLFIYSWNFHNNVIVKISNPINYWKNWNDIKKKKLRNTERKIPQKIDVNIRYRRIPIYSWKDITFERFY